MSSMPVVPEGITNPPIDDLLSVVDSKYALVIYAAKRARQINAYYSQLGEGLLEYVGPLVETHVQEKPLSVALREIDAGLLTITPEEPGAAYTDGLGGYSGDLSAGEMFGTDVTTGSDEAPLVADPADQGDPADQA